MTDYASVLRQLRNKLQPKSKKGIFIGYSLRTKGFCVELLDEDKVIDSINVSFNEDNPKESSHSEAILSPLFDPKPDSHIGTENEKGRVLLFPLYSTSWTA